MEVTLLPSSIPSPGQGPYQFLSCYLINRTVALDAGSLGFSLSPAEQMRVRHVFLTHSHLDHIASLPLFLENIYEGKAESVTVHGSEATLESLRRDLFNDRLWPDFIGMVPTGGPFLRLETLVPGRVVEVEGLRLTPVPVDHVVPTFGFLVEDAVAAFLLVSDTGPTQAIWDLANRTPQLRAVFLDAAFPNGMTWLAQASLHLTPAQFGEETRKLQRPVRFLAIHLKPRTYAEVAGELLALGLPNVEIVEPGRGYIF